MISPDDVGRHYEPETPETQELSFATCPFCGGNAVQMTHHWRDGKNIGHSVYCYSCGGQGGIGSEEVARRLWNAREAAALEQEVARLRLIAEKWSGWAYVHARDDETQRSAALAFDQSRGLPALEGQSNE